MALTGLQLLTGLSKFMRDYWASTATSNGAADGTTLIDTKLSRYGDDAIRGWYIRMSGGTCDGQVRRIWTFTGSSGNVEVRPAFSAQIDSGDTYELHRYDPDEKLLALDEARLLVYPEIAQIVYDDTTTADGISGVYGLPSTIRKGPAFVFCEMPIAADVSWNFDGDPFGDDSTKWSASSVTVATKTRADNDLVIPRVDDTCLTLSVAASTAGTLTQTVSNMTNSITAAAAAGRTMTAARWVYCEIASKVRLGVTDDSGTTYSSYHQGRGWELLTVTLVVTHTNSTTLSEVLAVANTSSAYKGALSRGWFYFGDAERVKEAYPERIIGRVRRDATTQQVDLKGIPNRGYQLRFVGKAPLSAISGSVTASMELDEPAAQVLYAEAAIRVYEGAAANSAMPEEMTARVEIARKRKNDYITRWPFHVPATGKLRGWN